MLKKLVGMILLVLMTASLAGAVEVGGVIVPETVAVNGEELILNGAGIRKKFFINIYVAALYVKEKTADAATIINADEPMVLKLEIVSSRLSSDAFKEATLEGFDEATGGNTGPIQAEIDMFMTAFSEAINKGDVFDIVYLPGQGVSVFKNKKADPEIVVEGLPVKKALFGIWLGDRTEKRLLNLAEDLLGR